jgi:large subunit ribosomal protein L12
MEYVYAAMLLHKAEKPINEENLTAVLAATGINVDPIRVKALVASLADVDIEKAIETATFMPSSAPTAPPVESEEKPEEKKEEEETDKEEAALEGLGALFG